MLIVESFNQYVFADVKVLLEAKYASDPAFSNVNIVLGHNVSSMTPEQYRAKNPGRKIIVYNMEQLYRGSYWVNESTMHWYLTADEVWDYDTENILFFNQHGIKASYHPMEYNDALLYNMPPVEKDIDVLFYGSLTDRRMKILQNWISMSMYHATTIMATGIKEDKLIDFIRRSKIILNLHAFQGLARQEQVRMFVPVINGACVVSEMSNVNEFGQAIVEARAEMIPTNLKNLLKTGDWEKVGANAPLVYKAHCATRR